MTNTIKDGGCAYPCEYHRRSGMHSTEKVVAKGMSLRDYFAGQALASGAFNDTAGTHLDDAKNAYKWADAMIAAREASQ